MLSVMKKSFLFYFTFLILFFAAGWYVVQEGNKLPVKPAAHAKEVLTEKTTADYFALSHVKEQFAHNINNPLSLLLLQVIIIITVSRLFGLLVRKFGQQTVVGEIIAGIVLGPSLMGLLFPDFFHFIFPADSLKNLQFLSQIGLAFFMFIIGMELDLDFLKSKAHSAIIVSHVSIIFPYFLGLGLSYYIFDTFAPAGISFLSFSLFMGIAMSITAFPVLARILKERKMTKSVVGTLALTCAAADDVTAWCILAVVIAIVKAGAITGAIVTVLLTLLYVCLMWYVVKPFLHKFGLKLIADKKNKTNMVAVSFGIMLVSAYLAEIIGIHALFGSFLAGVIMPHDLNFKKSITNKIEDVSLLVLLPIFFAFTGLRTQIGLLTEGSLWSMCAIIITVAVFGKFVGSALAAKFVGQSWGNALTVGALMNTRGLMELIVLNIGYDLGILSPQVFAIMVLMALATTFMTGPSLNLIEWFRQRKQAKLNL